MDGRTRFETEDGVVLEGEVRAAEGSPRGTAVICHPHPQHGGSKDHPLLWAIRNELATRGLTVLTFNFRGVMGSGGTYTGGVKEEQDLRAAIDRVREETDGPTVALGWSFGANVALREAVTDDRVAALTLVGVPLGETHLVLPPLPERSELRSLDRPVLIVVGAADPYGPVPEARSLARRIPGARLEVLPDTDHFFWKREAEVASLVGGFLEEALAAPRPA